MGKNQAQISQPTKGKSETAAKKKKPGRPSNAQIETQFMNIIRDTKLQAINAQTELQLQMAFFTTQDQKKLRRKQQSSVQDKKQKIFEFSLLTTDEKLNLVQFFQHEKANWKFIQIQQVTQLPEYFFDDQHDLSFMLYRLMRAKRQEVKKQTGQESSEVRQRNVKIQAEELFFMSLLCLNSQQTLKDAVLEFLLKNEDLIINLLRASMEKSRQKHKERIQKSAQLEKDSGSNQQLVGTRYHQASFFDDQNPDLSSLPKAKGKSKKIQKPSTKRQCKSKKHQSESQDEPILTQKQKQQKLIMCFINFTIWSYFYVYPQQEKSSSLVGNNEQKN